jgi:hypothetical protein
MIHPHLDAAPPARKLESFRGGRMTTLFMVLGVVALLGLVPLFLLMKDKTEEPKH